MSTAVLKGHFVHKCLYNKGLDFQGQENFLRNLKLSFFITFLKIFTGFNAQAIICYIDIHYKI